MDLRSLVTSHGRFLKERAIIHYGDKAPIAWQIREMEPEGFVLDSIITVIDCVNFMGYEDTSYTAKMQAQYTDVILLNKHELVTLFCSTLSWLSALTLLN